MEPANNYGATPAVPQRPTLLTILCILSFLGSSYGIFRGIQGYFASDFASSVVTTGTDIVKDELKDQPHGDQASKLMEKMTEGMTGKNLRNYSLISIFASVLTLAGAFMMWKLRKTGFYLYCAGVVTSIAGAMVIFGGNIIGVFTTAGVAFLGILFAVLYALNLKAMK
jgi:hypothetical protein